MRYFFTLLLITLTLNLFSSTLTLSVPGLSERELTQLESSPYIIKPRVNYKNGLTLLPDLGDLRDSFYKDLKTFDPEICIEMLYIIDKPETEQDTMVYLLNNFRELSDMAGLHVYSYTKERIVPLIEESYYVDRDKNRISDPVVKSLPDFQQHTLYQKDTTFYGNYYRFTTRTEETTIWMQMENIDDLKAFGFFKALEGGGERVNFIIKNSDNKIIFYALGQLKKEPGIKKILTFDVNIPLAFENRLNAIINWYDLKINNWD